MHKFVIDVIITISVQGEEIHHFEKHLQPAKRCVIQINNFKLLDFTLSKTPILSRHFKKATTLEIEFENK